MTRGRALFIVLVGLGLTGAQPAQATVLPSGFRETKVISNLYDPTAVAFAPDGRVFVSERRGVIKVFDDLKHPQPHVLADLRTEVYNGGDRGLLGLAVDPQFPTRPYVYALYTYDGTIGGAAPLWGTPGEDWDTCPDPPGILTDGCVVSGRLSRFTVSGNSVTAEKVLVNDWCQQFPSHSIGGLGFGADGALYASGGEGANYENADYGQFGQPPNPCGDPPAGVGGTQTLPTAEGGGLRAQDLRTSGDPATLDGSLIRVNADTGDALPTNPLASSSDVNARRIVAYGFRNPFRFAIRPGTNEAWVGNVGLTSYEAIDRVANPIGSSAPYNFGWPCFEGSSSPGVPWHQPQYDALDVNLCENLYADPAAVTPAYFSYQHGQPLTASENDCNPNSSAVSALAFYQGGSYPASYNGALFLGDYARGCIWVIPTGSNSLPDPTKIALFAHDPTSPPDPVDLKAGPGGDLFWLDHFGGTLRRIQYFPGNQPPVADVRADTTQGPIPLTVHLDGTYSTDADSPGSLTYAWDLNDDGAFTDSTAAKPPVTFNTAGPHTVSLKVTDSQNASDVAAIVIYAGNTSPTATINSPNAGLTWSVGDKIQLAGSGADAEDGVLPSNRLSWTVRIEHCPNGPGGCHLHSLTGFNGAGGTITAPDHEYLSRLLIDLTATDSGGLSNTKELRLNPATHDISLGSDPPGVDLSLGTESGPTPRTQTVISNSRLTVTAPSSQTINGIQRLFLGWSDAGARSHQVQASSDLSLNAIYAVPAAIRACPWEPPPSSTLQQLTVHRRTVALRGISSDQGCVGPGLVAQSGAVASVGVYIARMDPGGCRFLRASGRFTKPRPCDDPVLLPASGTDTWSRKIQIALPRGRYLAGAIATDDAGEREKPGGANLKAFRAG